MGSEASKEQNKVHIVISLRLITAAALGSYPRSMFLRKDEGLLITFTPMSKNRHSNSR